METKKILLYYTDASHQDTHAAAWMWTHHHGEEVHNTGLIPPIVWVLKYLDSGAHLSEGSWLNCHKNLIICAPRSTNCFAACENL